MVVSKLSGRKMKNILHIIDSVEPGGAENVFVDLILNLNQEEYHAVVTIPGRGWLSSRLDELSIDYHVIPASGSINFQYLYSLIKLIMHEKIDLVQSHLFGANVYSSLAGLLTNTPVISVFHGAVDIAEGEKLLWLKSRIIELGSNKVVTVSNSLSDEVISRTGINRKKICTIHNGVDTFRFSPQPHNQLKDEYNIPDKGFLVASIGYLRPPKGYELLLETAYKLVQEGKDIYFLIAGDGDGEYKDFLYEERERLRLDKNVLFVGAVDKPEYILNGSDLFLLPSISEGFSISTIEAMSCCLPVVVTRSGGPEEIVSDDIDGYLVEADVAGLSNKILTVMAHNDRKLIGNRARKAVQEKFSLLVCKKKYQDIYEEIFQRKH